MAASKLECEQFFRRLSKSLPAIWEKIATHCGLDSDVIETIKLNDTDAEERPFQFLRRLINNVPNLRVWSETLIDALRIEGRNDLVDQVEKFVLEVRQLEDARGEDIPGSEPSSSTSSTAKRPPEDDTGKDTGQHSSPKSKRVKKDSKTQPIPKPKLKLISEIRRKGGSGSWHFMAWIDRFITKTPQKGKGTYYVHCFLKDSSGVCIYTSIFYKEKENCLKVFNMIKASKKSKPICLRLLKIQKQAKKHLNQRGMSNYTFIINDQSEVSPSSDIRPASL